MKWLQARIERAWTMHLRTKARGDEAAATEWLVVWQKLCNEYIGVTEFKQEQWLG